MERTTCAQSKLVKLYFSVTHTNQFEQVQKFCEPALQRAGVKLSTSRFLMVHFFKRRDFFALAKSICNATEDYIVRLLFNGGVKNKIE